LLPRSTSHWIFWLASKPANTGKPSGEKARPEPYWRNSPISGITTISTCSARWPQRASALTALGRRRALSSAQAPRTSTITISRLPRCLCIGHSRVSSAESSASPCAMAELNIRPQPSARRAFWNIRIQGLRADTSPPAVAAAPAHLHVAEHPLGVRHQHGEAAVGGGHRGQAAGAAVGVERVGLGGLAVVVDEAHRALHLGASPRCEKSARPSPCATAIGSRLPAMPVKNRRRAVQHLDQRQPGLELLAACCA
jgi:hypothetical protein